MPLTALNCKVTGGTPKGMSRKLPAITRATLRATASYWHQNLLQGHFTPGNDSRFRFDQRNRVYMQDIKKKEGVGQGRYVKDTLKGQSLRWLRVFASITATSKQAVLRMTSPTYFERPFIGTFVDPKSGKTKHVTRQPDKPNEVTQVNANDHAALIRFARGDIAMRAELLMRGIGGRL